MFFTRHQTLISNILCCKYTSMKQLWPSPILKNTFPVFIQQAPLIELYHKTTYFCSVLQKIHQSLTFVYYLSVSSLQQHLKLQKDTLWWRILDLGTNRMTGICWPLWERSPIHPDNDLTVICVVKKRNCIVKNEHKYLPSLNTSNIIHSWTSLMLLLGNSPDSRVSTWFLQH